jgi:hypothetical protein
MKRFEECLMANTKPGLICDDQGIKKSEYVK